MAMDKARADIVRLLVGNAVTSVENVVRNVDGFDAEHTNHLSKADYDQLQADLDGMEDSITMIKGKLGLRL